VRNYWPMRECPWCFRRFMAIWKHMDKCRKRPRARAEEVERAK